MRAIAAAAIGAVLLLAGPAPAQDIDEGAALYGAFCATCHGMSGKGDGPTAEIMAIQPTDLTALSAMNGGAFPRGEVVMQIDGRMQVRGHGSPMPMFGPFFEGEDTAMKTEAGQPILTSRPVVDLVAWLESVQVAQ